MSRNSYTLQAFALGAGVMYLFDPRYGRRRRAMLRDKFISLYAQQKRYGSKAARDLAHRAQGMLAESKWMFVSGDAPDDVLEARVRSKLGRTVSHPHAIDVDVHDGHVTLRGPVLAHEVNDLLETVAHVHGVHTLDNRLDVHKTAGDIPSLQGGSAPIPERFELAQENWAPGARYAVGTLGGGLMLWGLSRGGIIGSLASAAGTGLLARAATNLDTRRLVGVGAGRRAIDVRKTININAPIEEVFDFWRHPENFPQFMGHVKEVRDLGNGRSHWTVTGPAGISVSFNAVQTRVIENQVLAWKTEPGAAVEHAGLVRFDRTPEGGTRADIRMSYNPVGGAIGHLVAMLFGTDPRHAMHDDLVRFKSLIERGKTSAPGKHTTREELHA